MSRYETWKWILTEATPKRFFQTSLRPYMSKGRNSEGGTEYPVGDAKWHVLRVPGGRGTNFSKSQGPALNFEFYCISMTISTNFPFGHIWLRHTSWLKEKILFMSWQRSAIKKCMIGPPKDRELAFCLKVGYYTTNILVYKMELIWTTCKKLFF